MNRRDVIISMATCVMSHRALTAPYAVPPDLRTAARDAWLFVLPLIEVAARRARPGPGGSAPSPLNRFEHSRTLASPTSRYVTTPNSDTLYSNAFVDTTRGPVSLEIPDCGSRYLSVQVMDMYTNNDFILGRRTVGGASGAWRLLPPGNGSSDVRDLRLATPHAWLMARILVDGQADLAAVHSIQDRLVLHGPAVPNAACDSTAASAWPIYFAAAQTLLKSDPPPFKAGMDAFFEVRDAGRARSFLRAGYTRKQCAAIEAGVADAVDIARSVRGKHKFIDGWTYPRSDLGEYGDHFALRAMVAVSGLGALIPAEAMYMRSAGDGHGLFEGTGLYRLRLPKAIPVDAFWSLTLYEALPDGRFFLTKNELHRYAIGDRTPGLVRAPGGVLDIWIGRSDPGGSRSANWLPAPKQGPFALTLRAYLPRAELLDGSYRLPPVISEG